jgi:membrane protein DedA with SNARE-associated domain
VHIDIQLLIHHYGYAGIFAILFFEMVGIPFPAETTLTVSGIEWTNGVFSLLPLLLAAAAGNIFGSTIAFAIGRYLGRPVIVRYGKYVGITDARLNKANEAFARYRSSVVLFSKFIAGIRVLVPYLAGLNRMPFALFTLYNAISAIAWSAVFIVLGRYIGIGWTRYHQALQQYLLPAILVAGVGLVLFILWKRRKKKRSSMGALDESTVTFHQEG